MATFSLFLGMFEVVARSYGYLPQVTDSKDLWARERDRISAAGEESVVLLGASRMQLGLVPEVFSEYFPGSEVVMLAVDGQHPMATLQSLAEDEPFTGTVLCSLTMGALMPGSWRDQESHVVFYDTTWTDARRRSHGGTLFLEERLALLHQRFRAQTIISSLVGRPFLEYLSLSRNRHVRAHYWKLGAHLPAHARARADRTRQWFDAIIVPSPEEMEESYALVEAAVRSMKGRGCRVLFVRLPSSGPVWELEEQYFPRRLYWDRFAALSTAETVHFRDHPELSGFDCPDGSHLGFADAGRFTRALADLLLQDSASGLVRTPPAPTD